MNWQAVRHKHNRKNKRLMRVFESIKKQATKKQATPGLRSIRLTLRAIILAFLFLFTGQIAIFAEPVLNKTQSLPESHMIDQDNSAVITELEAVEVPLPGPKLWRLTKGESQVIILGYVTPMPHRLDWSKIRLEGILSDTKKVLIPPEVHINPFDAVKLLWNITRFYNPRGQSLEQVLSPEDYQTFLSYVKLSGKNPDHYTKWKPGIAGLALIEDVRKSLGFSSAKPVSTIKKMAKAAHVSLEEMAHLPTGSLINFAVDPSAQKDRECFQAEMREIAFEVKNARAVAEFWARGDLENLRRERRDLAWESCLQSAQTTRNLMEKLTAETVTTLKKALSRPGKTLALIDIAYLDHANGPLDQLKSEGVTITTPH